MDTQPPQRSEGNASVAAPTERNEANATSLMAVNARPEAVMARGEGSWLWDEDGRRYLDFIQGWAVNCLGHAPAVVRRALAEQSSLLLSPSPAFHNRPALDLADTLSQASGLGRVYFCTSGAEANEGALKLARKWGQTNRAGAFEVITTDGAFHGRTLATMAASGKPGWDQLFAPNPPGFRRVPFGDLAAMEAAIGPETVAVMVEPIQGEGGVVTPPDGYLAGLRVLTQEHGILLMLDEIQTGVGRTGTLFAFEHEAVTPDVLTLGKGLGGGLPISALLAREEVACFEYGDQGGTFNGNPVLCAVAAAVWQSISTPGFLDAVRRRADHLERGLQQLAERLPGTQLLGRGLLRGLRLPRPVAALVAQRCFDNGLLINAPRPDRLRFMPALDVHRGEVDTMLKLLAPELELALGHGAPGNDAVGDGDREAGSR